MHHHGSAIPTSMSIFTSLLCFIVAGVGSATGVASKDEAKFYELKQGNLSVKFTNLGARIVSLSFPDKHGKLADIVLGHDSIKEYTTDVHNLGAIVGRVTNVIKGAEFELNGTRYELTANDGKHTLNGGHKGFGFVVWKVTHLRTHKRFSEITFTYKSFDGEEGFPGNLTVAVKYTVEDKKLVTEVNAHTENKATPVNLGHHVVWNLAGHSSGNILSHGIQIFGSKFIDVDQRLIPTGKILPAKGTPYDFLKPHAIGSRINKIRDGYKINYVLNDGHDLKLAAILHDRKSERILKLWTTQTTLLFSTTNKMKIKGKDGFLYNPHAGCGLDPQGYPDSLNHPKFPSLIVSKGKPYKQRTAFEFSIRA